MKKFALAAILIIIVSCSLWAGDEMNFINSNTLYSPNSTLQLSRVSIFNVMGDLSQEIRELDYFTPAPLIGDVGSGLLLAGMIFDVIGIAGYAFIPVFNLIDYSLVLISFGVGSAGFAIGSIFGVSGMNTRHKAAIESGYNPEVKRKKTSTGLAIATVSCVSLGVATPLIFDEDWAIYAGLGLAGLGSVMELINIFVRENWEKDLDKTKAPVVSKGKPIEY